MRFNHVGIPTTTRFEGEIDLPHLKVTVSPALNRMLVKGWLKSEWGLSEHNRRARFYRLTLEGRAQLDKESNAFSKMVRAIQLVMGTS